MRSLVVLVLVGVLGVVVALGLGVVFWVTQDDLDRARADADVARQDFEVAMQDLARALLTLSQDTTTELVAGSERAWRRWLSQEPLSLYREPGDPERVDVEAIQAMLLDGVGWRGVESRERIPLLIERLSLAGDARIDAAVETLRRSTSARAEEAALSRRRTLVLRFSFVLLGLGLLLTTLLLVFVVGPVRRLRTAVDRIARGDLETPVGGPTPAPQELADLVRDVERMRHQIHAATEGLEAEVARKTRHLQTSLAERTQALEELEATKGRLVQAAKMAGLGTLAGGVAHEFNNLVGGIVGCIESAQTGVEDPRAQEDLAMARKTAGRAAVLVRALLDVARPGARSLVPTDVRAVVQDVLRTAAPAAGQAQVSLELAPGASPQVLGDEGQLHQVVLNLVTNAIQASPVGGEVEVTVARAGTEGVLTVSDAGPGVAPGERDRIFEPFFTTRPEGTGLGLFVSYGIVERHGGTISVDPGPAGGARFRVALPLADMGTAVAEDEAS